MQQQQQMSLHQDDTQNGHFDPTSSSSEDFLDQMLSALPSCSWPPDLSAPDNHQYHHNFEDQSLLLASKFQQNQITANGGVRSDSDAKLFLLQQQQQLLSRGLSGPGASDSGFSPGVELDASVQALLNGSLHGSDLTSHQPQHFQHPQGRLQNFGAPAAAAAMNQAQGTSDATADKPRQRVRARRGQATDPHSIAERLRRERIAERMKSLQELVPNANKTDKASMLDEIIDYVKFLQLQVKVLSVSRLGGAAAVAPLVSAVSSEGRGDCIRANGGIGGRSSNGMTPNRTQTTAKSSNNSMTVTEHQVAKLMEEDMGSAMQYLQGKGLCLMPISLATAISTATTGRNPHHRNPMFPSNGDGSGGPSSPSMSALTVQSAPMGGNSVAGESSVKDANSVSKP